MLTRRRFLPALAGGVAPALAQGRPPNIIFILADDLGWGDLGCYGHQHIRTPNLDRLARQGTQFTQFYVNGSVCSPTRSAFMTGHFPARHRVHGHFAEHKLNEARGMPDWLDPAVGTLPRLLQQAGYATAHFGKWHLGSGEGAPEPSAYGFQEHRTVNANGPSWDQRDRFFRARSTELIVDEAIRFVERNRNRPFYVNAWTLLPHATLDPTEEQLKLYERYAPAGGVPHKGATQIFYASVGAIDQAVGRLLARLDELGVAENTLVLFSSDNGPEDMEIRNASHSGAGTAGPFRGRKRSLYEGGVRVPLLARWPARIRPGRVDDASVWTGVDFLPTLAKLAGGSVPAEWKPDGEDVSGILLGQPRPRTKPVLWEWRFRIAGHTLHRSPILAIRDGDWKLLLNPDRSRVELYDIPRDPSELHNLAPDRPQIVERLAKTALAWQKTLPEGPFDPGAGSSAYPWPRR
ncbi:MAG: N-acetylgalactosamine 6-sulfate sulfatase (GALNS) [Acidobacteria bacterium]|nr:N-acetylgalactosamine 6-sulfate sulfatase (GALNS) [Acidobacteriota bacterium]